MTLRGPVWVMSVLAIALAYSPRNFFRPPAIIAGLCVLKVERPDLFVKAKKGTVSYAEVEPVLKLSDTEPHQRAVKLFNAWWAFALGQSVDQDLLQSLRPTQ